MTFRSACLTSALALAAGSALADPVFNRTASFPVAANMPEGTEPLTVSSAEIVTASGDGLTLVYTDSPMGVLGFVDITDPAAPVALGALALDGEPTSVTAKDALAYAAVNTRADFITTSGYLATIDIATRTEVARCDLGGQPDSIALAPDGSFLAVAIENERDEDAGDGRVPQMPAGWVSLFAVTEGAVDCASEIRADLTGLAEVAPEDPEPEFVDINAEGEIAVTLQENNHIAVLARDGSVIAHFSAGAVDLTGIDATDEQAAFVFDEAQAGVLREPDALQWIDDTHFAIANEGDMDGGSRGWSILSQTGEVIWDSGATLEHAIAAIGHHPDRRSDSKGAEPEGLEFALFDGVPHVFVLAERASVVAVYDVTDPAAPVLAQFLPSGISPEGAVAIPARGILATANEVDLGEDGLPRSHVMVYARAEGTAAYPHVTSAGGDDLIGWTALSGFALDPAVPGQLYAVTDSFAGFQPRIFTMDVTQTPARITGAIDVTRAGYPAQKIDLEGIVADGEGGFWLASEGRSDRLVPHALLHVDAGGTITQEVPFPAEALAYETRFGAEGIALVDGVLWVAIQRPWGDDPENTTKLMAYTIESGEWGAVRYPLEVPTGEGWVGLSEIAIHGEHAYLIERDNHVGENAVVKQVTRVPLAEMVPAPLGGELPLVTKEVVRDLIPDLRATGGYVLDKVESLVITPEGIAWAMTDNDGVNDSSGETMLWSFPVE